MPQAFSNGPGTGPHLAGGRHMSRRDEEPIFIAEFDDPGAAEKAWSKLIDVGIASAVITDDPPWGPATHRIQIQRRDAAAALEALNGR